MLDLQTLSDEIKESIDEAIVRKAEGPPRKHLGASLIGHECKAYLWFSFRWAKLGENFSAQKLRLFERGNLEEQRFVTWLRDSGWNVEEYDPIASEAAGKPVQWRMSAVMGHYGGSCDGFGYHPKYAQLGKVLLEFKTKGTGRGFTELTEKGVVLTNGQHYSQMCQYGMAYSLEYAIYQTINKNDDSLHLEVVKLDYNRAQIDIQKAEEIINAHIRPNRVSETETYFRCKFCNFIGVCHRGDIMDRNCRSCTNATPIDEGQWFCAKWHNIIPDDYLIQGCDSWIELEH